MTESRPAAGEPAAGLRKPLLAANWKMNKTRAEARAFMQELLPGADAIAADVEIVVCPPYTALETVIELARESPVLVGAQNMHAEDAGAYTGEVSAPMLVELGVDAVILGHSERRQYFAESDAALARKVPRALDAGFTPILCVGETEEERAAGETERKLRHQVQSDLAAVDAARLPDVVIAYEPIWAIGTGNNATPEQAQEAIAFVRALVRDRDADAAQRTRILYGGSVDPGNAQELLSRPDVDGALVGGASLHADRFLTIAAAARA
jgi:triosephosphate isomerase (TIM)